MLRSATRRGRRPGRRGDVLFRLSRGQRGHPRCRCQPHKRQHRQSHAAVQSGARASGASGVPPGPPPGALSRWPARAADRQRCHHVRAGTLPAASTAPSAGLLGYFRGRNVVDLDLDQHPPRRRLGARAGRLSTRSLWCCSVRFSAGGFRGIDCSGCRASPSPWQ